MALSANVSYSLSTLSMTLDVQIEGVLIESFTYTAGTQQNILFSPRDATNLSIDEFQIYIDQINNFQRLIVNKFAPNQSTVLPISKVIMSVDYNFPTCDFRFSKFDHDIIRGSIDFNASMVNLVVRKDLPLNLLQFPEWMQKIQALNYFGQLAQAHM